MALLSKDRIKIIVTIVCAVIAFLFVYNDFSLYKSPIARVDTVEVRGEKQIMTGKIMNGPDKGKSVKIASPCDKTLIYNNKYRTGNYLFIGNSADKSGAFTVAGMKRDYFIVGALLVLFIVLIAVGGKQGFFTIIGLFINTVIFSFAMVQYSRGRNILLMTVIATVLVSAVVLLFINGFNRKAALTVAATVITVLVISGMTALIMQFAPRIQYEFMDFMPEPYTVKDSNLALLSEVMVGCLGAVMDIAVLMTTAASEIIERKPDVTEKEIFLSCRAVADDITGTMINIIMLTNIAAFIPVFALSLENGFEIRTIIKNNMYFETVRFLTGGTGIILSIPISIFVAAKFIKKPAKRGEAS